MNFNFGEVLTRAWQIIWKYKILWIFGILASCGRNGNGGGGGARGASNTGNDPNGEIFRQWAADHPGLVALAVIGLIILVLLFIFLGTVGKIGLIKGTYKAEHGTERLVLGELFSESTPYFGRVFGLSFLVALIFAILFVPISLMGTMTAGIAYICLLPIICILFLLGWVIAVVVEQANVAIVLEDLGMGAGFRRGWEIVRSNIGPALIMALILGVIALIVGMILAIPILGVVFPTVASYRSNTENAGPLVFMSICLCFYLPIAIFLQGIVVSYIQSAWALTYMRLTNKPAMGTPATPAVVPPAPLAPSPSDSEKTLIAREPKDDDKTFIAKKPDA